MGDGVCLVEEFYAGEKEGYGGAEDEAEAEKSGG